MAGDFQKQFNEALKEAELDDVKKSVDALRSLNPADGDQEAAQSVREGGRRCSRRARRGDEAGAFAGAEPASDAAQPAEPLKSGAAGDAGRVGPAEAAAAACRPRRRAVASRRARAPVGRREPANAQRPSRRTAQGRRRSVGRSRSLRHQGCAAEAGRQGAPQPKPAETQAAAAKAERPPPRKRQPEAPSERTGRRNRDKSSAPLIEHLIELRTRLIWSLGGFFVAFLVCFFFAKQLFNLLVIPFKWAVDWAGLDIAQGRADLHRAAGILLHADQAGDVRRRWSSPSR